MFDPYAQQVEVLYFSLISTSYGFENIRLQSTFPEVPTKGRF